MNHLVMISISFSYRHTLSAEKKILGALNLLFRVVKLPLLALCCSAGLASAADMEITPFNTSNLSPLVQIYGLPQDTGADIATPGKFRLALNQDLSSNYTVKKKQREQIIIDGETYRVTVAARYGIAPNWEAGVEIPYIIQGGGFLDSFIIDWHNTFHLPQGGRDHAAKNRLNFSYRKDGEEKLRIDHAVSGIGDISLTGGYRLYDVRDSEHHSKLAVKGAVKLPTGDSASLLGSGGTDAMLQLCGTMNSYTEWGTLGVYGSVGGLVMSKSDVLSEQHQSLAGGGTLGVGWGPASWISFKVQLNANTPLYRDSSLNEISVSPLLLLVGGALNFPDGYLLDIGVAEDLRVGTAPDVSFHLGLSKQF